MDSYENQFRDERPPRPVARQICDVWPARAEYPVALAETDLPGLPRRATRPQTMLPVRTA